jgi:acyl-CoA synthetase (AMP-forming)/AMP-acid ligase II
LHELIDCRLVDDPLRTVFIFNEQQITAAALRRRRADLAAALQARGVAPGEAVTDPVDHIAAAERPKRAS